MHRHIESTLDQLESGAITRRQAVAQLAALTFFAGAAAPAAAQDSAPTFRAVGLNHIALNVPDVQKSRDFYVKHLGMQVVRDNESNCFMTCNEDFVALFRSATPGMDHYCYSVENYDVRDAEAKLKAEGIEPRVQGQRIYFPDPDGLTVQLAAADHRP